MLASLKSFWESWKQLGAYKSLPSESRRFSVYSEGPQDWPHLGTMLKAFLDLKPEAHLSYLSSEKNDPGLRFEHPRFHRFWIGSGATRTIFFKTTDAKMLLMSLPDLNVYELKKSTFPVHYVYAFHSINSTHVVYRERAFEFFDTIFCVGPHHVKELRKEESIKGLAPRRLLEHGSVKLDAVIAQYQDYDPHALGAIPFVLLAPSWGECSFAEDASLIRAIVKGICSNGWICSLRLHPMTIRHHPLLVDGLLKQFASEVAAKQFRIETDMNDNSSLKDSHLMVSDWSGAATEYAFALGKPVLFVDTPQKINNPSWEKFDIRPLEDSVRHRIGQVVKPCEVPDLMVTKIKNILGTQAEFQQQISMCRSESVFCVGRSAQVGAQHLADIYEEFVK